MKAIFTRHAGLIIFVVVLLAWVAQTKTVQESWNESTRLAAIQSLVEFGTWQIDRSPYAHETGDRWLSADGHYYSDKPPLFAALGAVPYALLYHGAGIRLNPEGCLPGNWCAYSLLTVLLVGLPSAGMAALFYRLAARQLRSLGWAVALTVLLCFGTVVWPYSLVFNHHLPAAVALFAAFYLLNSPTVRWPAAALAGLLAGAAVMLDLTAIFIAAALAGLALLYHRRQMFPFAAAAALPGIVTVIFNRQITGGLLFPYFTPEGYAYPGSPFFITVGAQQAAENIPRYIFRSLIGDQGWFWFSPLLLFAVAGAVRLVTRRARPPLYWAWLLVLAGIGGQLVFVLTRTINFGGDAYGERYLIPSLPLLFAFIIFAVPQIFRRRGGALWAALFGAAAVVSVFASWQGVQVTWHQVEPPVYLDIQPGPPFVAVRTNPVMPEYRPPDRSQLQRRALTPPADIEHRLDANFGGDVTLLGYSLPANRIEPGQTLEVTLVWQSRRVPPVDDFAFVNLLDAAQNRAAGSEGVLVEKYPLRYWFPGEVVTDRRQIPVAADTPPGLHRLAVGLYRLDSGENVEPLPLLNPETGQPTGQTGITIGPIAVGGPPPELLSDSEPQTAVGVVFGGQIELLGFDANEQLAMNNGQLPMTNDQTTSSTNSTNSINLKLFWQAVRPPDADYTLFVHVRDAAGNVAAQKDQPLSGGIYPSSLWEPGERLVDSVSVPLPENLPPGRYSVVAGLYNLDTGQRLAVPGSADNSLQLAELEIE